MSSQGIIYLILAASGGGLVGMVLTSLLVNNKTEEAYMRGFERGKTISANSIK